MIFADLPRCRQFFKLFFHLRAFNKPSSRLLSPLVSSNPREITIQTLRKDTGNSDFVENLLNKNISKSNLTPQDRALAREMTMGMVRWRLTLEWLARRKLRTEPPELGLLLICLGLYQLFWMRVPQHAAVFETVELCERLVEGKYKTLVNAVLRGYGRRIEETRKLLKELGQRDPALAASHPQSLYERSEKQRRKSDQLAFMEWNNSSPHPFLRVNTLQTSVAELLERLKSQGVEAEEVSYPFLTEQILLKLPPSVPPHLLEGYAEGLFYIQDPATLLSVQALEPQPGQRVLDHCAAPGGKTTYIAQRMKNQGSIVAVDIEERLELIRVNCYRLRIEMVEAVAARDFQIRPAVPEFDRILLDVPCSNTGVLRRRVEARYRLNLRELELLREIQAGLLDAVSPRLKEGGLLVYSTCSVDCMENEQQVAGFLRRHPEFEKSGSRFLLPHQEKTDGAYVAVLKRK